MEINEQQRTAEQTARALVQRSHRGPRDLTLRSLLVEIEALIAQGVYPPGTPRIHGLAEGPAVLQRLASGETSGKFALDPWRWETPVAC